MTIQMRSPPERDKLPEAISKGSATKEECIDLIMRVQKACDTTGVRVHVGGRATETGFLIRIHYDAPDSRTRQSTNGLIMDALVNHKLTAPVETNVTDDAVTMKLEYTK